MIPDSHFSDEPEFFEPNRAPARFTLEPRLVSRVKEIELTPTMARILNQLLPGLFTPTDEQLLWRGQQQDDAAAYGELALRWEQPIRRLCERMTNDPHRAEDLAQEVFTRVFTGRLALQPNARFSTWLWRVALNLCYDELRRRQRRAEFSLDELVEDDSVSLTGEEPSPAARLEERERGTFVRAALQQLPEHYRAVVVLRHYEGLKFRQIAEVLEIPEGTVKSRMAEALDHLAVLLKEFSPPVGNVPKPKPNLCV